MGLWPEVGGYPPPVMLTPFGPAAAGAPLAAAGVATPASTVIGTGNVALSYELALLDTVTLVKAFALNGATVNGNWDVGLYDGERQLLISTGSVAQAGPSVVQEQDITDITVGPGLYYLAFAFSSATAAYFATSISGPAGGIGGNLMLTAFPLPATFVSGGFTSIVPVFGFSSRTLVA